MARWKTLYQFGKKDKGPTCCVCKAPSQIAVQFMAYPNASKLEVTFPAGWVPVVRADDPTSEPFVTFVCGACASKPLPDEPGGD